jgi:hypothetical protein
MRPQQQNRRMRGRNGGGSNNNNNNNNNRKGPNPLTRNYESNGPDVKIRGSAQQVAEKYAQLARDAHSSGDRVMAENYLQHAEHYNRIIAAAQAQMPIQNPQNQREGSDEDMDDERDEFDNPNSLGQTGQQNAGQGNYQGNGGENAGNQNLGNQSSGNQNDGSGDFVRSQHNQAPDHRAELGSGPQPVIEGMPAEVALNPEAAGEGNAPRERSFNGEPGEGRRNRRPRRGERPRPDTAEPDVADSTEGLAATLSRGAPAAIVTPEPASEVKEGGGAALVDADG